MRDSHPDQVADTLHREDDMPTDDREHQADLEAAKRRLFPEGVPNADLDRFKLRLDRLPDVLAYPTPDEAAGRFHRFLNPETTTTATSAADALRAWFEDTNRELREAAADLPPAADEDCDGADPEVVAYVYPSNGMPSVRFSLHGVDPLIYAIGPWLDDHGPLPVRIEVGGRVLEGELRAACACGMPQEGRHRDDCDGYRPGGWFPGQAPDDDDEGPACALCGCTERRACFPTCWWVQADPNLCDKCAARHGGVEGANALIEQRELAGKCPRCAGPWLPIDGDCDTCGFPGPLVGELCEGCRAVATCRDSADVPLCTACFQALPEVAEDIPPEAPGWGAAEPEVIYRWDDQAGAVVVELDGEPCGKLRLRPELLAHLPPDLDDMIARLRRAVKAGREGVQREADLVVLAISLAVHAHDEDTSAGVRAFPGVASMLDDQAPIGPGWGTTREGVRRRGALGRTPEPTE